MYGGFQYNWKWFMPYVKLEGEHTPVIDFAMTVIMPLKKESSSYCTVSLSLMVDSLIGW